MPTNTDVLSILTMANRLLVVSMIQDRMLIKNFFEELKEAADVLRTAKEKDVASFMMFDYAYGGNLNKWAQLCNTIRLRLAMRIVKYDAAWAKVRRKLP